MSDFIYILGAGASKHLDYPLGKELIDNILAITSKNGQILPQLIPQTRRQFKVRDYDGKSKSMLEFYYLIYEACNILGISTRQIDVFYNKLLSEYSSTPSIDSFISNLSDPELEIVGKLAIVLAIVYCERTYHNTIDGWYKDLVKQFYPVRGNEYDFSSLKIITFNYDRSLDWFISQTVYSHYKNHSDNSNHEDLVAKTNKALKSLEIIHVYGKINYNQTSEGYIGDYGEIYELLLHSSSGNNKNMAIKHIVSAANNISTIYESNSNKISEYTFKLLESNSPICILGFGFHQPNFDILGVYPPNQLIKSPYIYSSAYKLPSRKKDLLSSLLLRNDGSLPRTTFGEWDEDINKFYNMHIG